MAMNNKNDARSKKIVFCSSCLLNTNNKVLALARYGGFSKEFIDILAKYDLGVQQMDCRRWMSSISFPMMQNGQEKIAAVWFPILQRIL